MKEQSSERGSAHRIYISSTGQRYVKPEELFRDPRVIRRLGRADTLARRLGLKGEPGSHSHD